MASLFSLSFFISQSVNLKFLFRSLKKLMFGASIISFHPAFPFSLHLKFLKISVEKVQGKSFGILFLGLIRHRPLSLNLYFSIAEKLIVVKSVHLYRTF